MLDLDAIGLGEGLLVIGGAHMRGATPVDDGRILRPKADGGQAYFYAVVSHDTLDRAYSDHRQLFLTEQGYRYEIEDFTPAPDLVNGVATG